MTRADYAIAAGLGFILGAVLLANIVAGLFLWGVLLIALAVLFAPGAKTT